MGRGRVEMKTIENKVNRQITFSKRRNGLMKKAAELAVLCDAELALIIFSSSGKVYEFGSHPSGVMHTLERYKHCSFTTPGAGASDPQHEIKTESAHNWENEMMELRTKIQSLERFQRNLVGEDLESLNLKELQDLENQLEEALALTRQRQDDFMREHLEHLRKKERYLVDINKQLKMKIEAMGQDEVGLWNGCRMEGSSSYANANETHPFQPMDCKPEPILQMGYTDYVPFQEVPSDQKGKMVAENEFMQVWDPLSSDFKLFIG